MQNLSKAKVPQITSREPTERTYCAKIIRKSQIINLTHYKKNDLCNKSGTEGQPRERLVFLLLAFDESLLRQQKNEKKKFHKKKKSGTNLRRCLP